MRNGAIVLGTFDGIHKGHMAVLDSAKEYNPKTVITFAVPPAMDEQPELILSAAEKNQRLREMGFSVFVQRTAGAYPTGEVLEMEPAAGTTLPLGSKVILTVSEGLPTVSVTVPELRGLSRADALMRIWTAQLALGEVVEVPSGEGTGTVLRQSHLPGTTVPAGTKITIYVSSMGEDEGFSSEAPYR
jgi:serine/threonine-protein kinase